MHIQMFSQRGETDRSPFKYCDHRFSSMAMRTRAERQVRQGEGCDDRCSSGVHPFGENLLSDPFTADMSAFTSPSSWEKRSSNPELI
jgi:hypothetical protein